MGLGAILLPLEMLLMALIPGTLLLIYSLCVKIFRSLTRNKLIPIKFELRASSTSGRSKAENTKNLFTTNETDEHLRHVVISGCDSGFGHAIALRLASRGLFVHAGCLTSEGVAGISELAKQQGFGDRLKAVLLDVTNDDNVAGAARDVAEMLPAGRGLWAIICNAGTPGSNLPDSWNTIKDFQFAMDVNFYGQVRMIHHFRPLMKEEDGGRLVFMCSMMGHNKDPYCLPYVASKHATVGYAEGLRMELGFSNVKVITLCPGFVKTKLVDPHDQRNGFSRRWQNLSASFRRKYIGADENNIPDIDLTTVDADGAVVLPDRVKRHSNFVTSVVSFLGMFNSFERVVSTYEHAVLARYPKLTYHIGFDASCRRVLSIQSADAHQLIALLFRWLYGDSLNDRI